MTQIDLLSLDPRDRCELLTGLVVPRPVACVTTLSGAGIANAAPDPVFDVFGSNPTLVILGLERWPDGAEKDTARDIRVTGAFVVDIATPALTEAIVATAAARPSDQSGPGAPGLATAESVQVKPPRLRDVPVAIACRHILTPGPGAERDIVLGEAAGFVTRDGPVDVGGMHVDRGGDFPVARVFADRYVRTEDIERHPIPILDRE